MPINVPPHKEKKGFWNSLFDTLIPIAGVAAAPFTGGASLGAAGAAMSAKKGVEAIVKKDVSGAISGIGGGLTSGISNLTANKPGKQIGLEQNQPISVPGIQDVPKPDMTLKPTPVSILSRDNPGVQQLQLQDSLSALDSLPTSEADQLRPTFMSALDEIKKRNMNRYKTMGIG